MSTSVAKGSLICTDSRKVLLCIQKKKKKVFVDTIFVPATLYLKHHIASVLQGSVILHTNAGFWILSFRKQIHRQACHSSSGVIPESIQRLRWLVGQLHPTVTPLAVP